MKQTSNVMIYAIQFICNIHIDFSTYLYFCIVKNSMSYENFHLPNGFRASPFNYQRKQASVVKFNDLILQFLANILVKFEEKLSIFLFQNIYLIFIDYGKILSGSPGKRNPLLKVKWSFPNDFMPD